MAGAGSGVPSNRAKIAVTTRRSADDPSVHDDGMPLPGPPPPRTTWGLATSMLSGAGSGRVVAEVEPPERLGEGERRGEAIAGRLAHGAGHHVVDGGRGSGQRVAQARRILEDDLHRQGHHVVAAVGLHAREQLEQHHAQREQVARRGRDPIAARLLRRQVGGRAQREPGGRERPLPARARDADVDELHAGARGRLHEEEAGGLDVAVDDAGPVQRRKAERRLADDLHHAARAGAPGLLPASQVLAVEPLEDQVGAIARVAPVGYVPDHVRAVELGEQGRLALEARDHGRLAEVGVEALDRDRRVGGEVTAGVEGSPRAARDEGVEAEAWIQPPEVEIGAHRAGV